MQILPVKNSSFDKNQKINFGYSKNYASNEYSKRDKIVVAATTAIGVATSLAILAKTTKAPNGLKYSLNPKKMFKNIKKSYLAKAGYFAKEVITIGAGSCLGGLAGGYIIDKNSANRKAKRRETLMQIGNISIPILTVDLMVDKIFAKSNNITKAFAGLGGVFIGVFAANIIMNKLCDYIFENKKGRGVKVSDYSAHLDDVVLAAKYIAPRSSIVQAIGTLIPAALMVAGNEIGRKQA